MKAFLIGLVIVIAGLAVWRIAAGRVDRTKPTAVAKAFIAALRDKDISKAGNYWLPESADTWRDDATRKLGGMQGGQYDRFFENLADGSSEFTVDARVPQTGDTEQHLVSGNTTVDLRKIDGKWYVFKGPL